MAKSPVLLVGDEETMSPVRDALRSAGFEPALVSSVAGALHFLNDRTCSHTLLSLSFDEADLALVRRLAEDGRAGVLLGTASANTFRLTVRAREAGIGRVFPEPPDPEQILEELNRKGPGATVPLPPLEQVEEAEGPLLIGSSAQMEEVFHRVATVADSSATLLLTGESGTGKELVARAVHWASPRRGAAFIPVNCAAIPEHLLESELFGHERGAFTGAEARRRGRFERADGGTLFLDEIGDMSLVLQAKILRALEEGEVERLGGEASVEVDVRIVAATNRNLQEAVRSGEFREDLFYRLAVVQVPLPPLRERHADLEPLALHFAAFFSGRYGRTVQEVSKEALGRLRQHTWPGNVRELRNVMDRAVLVCRGSVIEAEDLELGGRSPRLSPSEEPGPEGFPPDTPLADVEASHIRTVLEYTDGHMGRAAELLGIHRNTLTRKVSAYEVPVPGRPG